MKKYICEVCGWVYDEESCKENGIPFDIALKRKDGYDIYEAKYYKGKMPEKEMLEEERQIEEIRGINVNKIGFITVSGVENALDRFEYVVGDELYDNGLV